MLPRISGEALALPTRDLTGPAAALEQLSTQGQIIDHQQQGASARVLVRLTVDARFLDPRWQRHPVGMDTVVLGYLRGQRFDPQAGPHLQAAS